LTCRNELGRQRRNTDLMWPYYPDLLATPVPRYTSFPTAAEFRPEVGAPDLLKAIEGVEGDVSLYVHIPFCETICWYCGCNTARSNRIERLTGYLDALHREIALVGKLLPTTARIRRIAFGGGSPNAIAPTDFVRLVVALTQSLPLAEPEFSIELDPRTLEEAWTEVLAAVGVRRASLGVQTFAPRLQKAIGRQQPANLVERCSELLRRAGVTSLNFDLMYGLPGQTIADLEETLDQTSRLDIDRIALFGYAHVPQLITRQRKIDASALPDQAMRFAMAAHGHEWLVDSGYTAVGFDHFALPGDPLAQAAHSGRLRRNFQGFTDDSSPAIIGIGASAISSFAQLLAQNEKNAGRYGMMLSNGRLPAVRGCRRSADDRKRGAIIEALLCNGHTALGGYLTHEVVAHLEPFITRGLAYLDDGHLSLAATGLPYARAIAAIFDPYRQFSDRRFSSAV
jgi:oxygen-independent coproporphyrinogen-3 oxidase